MDIRLLTSPADLKTYDQWVRNHSQGSLWQSLERKRYVEACGKQTRVYGVFNGQDLAASALVVIDRTSAGFSTWDIPRGPLGPLIENGELRMENYVEDLLRRIVEDAKQDRCLSLFFSSSQPLPILHSPFSILNSSRHIHADATRIIDLIQPEETILAQMHQKGRYNIKVAQKNGVSVTRSNDIDAFYNLLQTTGERDRFVINSKSHYERFLKNLEGSFLLLALYEGKPVAGLIGVLWEKTGIYYYGASDYEHRALMAPYLLQWEAMTYCKQQGCTHYDLLGIAPPDAPADHPWQGISGFKEKFGGMVVTYPPEQQIVLRPMMNGLLQMKRKLIG